MTEPATPRIVTRDEWEQARAELLVREKAHTHAGDELAAARRRLPMTRMEPVMVVGPQRPRPSRRCVRRPAHVDRVSLHVEKRRAAPQAVRGLHAQSGGDERRRLRLSGRARRELRRLQQRPMERDRRLPRLHGLDDAVVLDRRLRQTCWRPEPAATSAATCGPATRCSKRMKRSGAGSRPCCPPCSCSTSLLRPAGDLGRLARRLAAGQGWLVVAA